MADNKAGKFALSAVLAAVAGYVAGVLTAPKEGAKTREELTTLPGVGRKTANVVMNEAFGEPTIAVDTHIFRVSNRTGLAKGKNPDEVEAGLEKIVPKEFKLGAHHWLILHGRYICVARKPKCNMCPIVHLCQFDEKIGGEL